MDIVIDANILFAIAIRKGITERILFSDALHIYAPEYLFLEFKEHKEYLLRLTNRSADEFIRLIEVLERRIELIPSSEFRSHLQEAETEIADKDDAVYLAVCLAKKMPLWSNDNGFAQQKRVRVFTTQQLIAYLRIEENG
jgi:predicted nucleic acid-binding protein